MKDIGVTGLVIVSALARSGYDDSGFIEMLAACAGDREIWLVVDEGRPPPPGLPEGARTVEENAFLTDAYFAGLPCLYQIGNHADHLPVLRLLLRRPGVVLLQDFRLDALAMAAAQAEGLGEILCGLAQHDHGAVGARLAEEWRARGWTGRFPRDLLAFNGMVLAQATALVVRDRRAQFAAAAREPGLAVHYLPQMDGARLQAILNAAPMRRASAPAISLSIRGRDAARRLLTDGRAGQAAHDPALWWRYPVQFRREAGGCILCVDDEGRARARLATLFDVPDEAIESLTAAQLVAQGEGAVCDAALLLIDADRLADQGAFLRAVAARLRWGAPVVIELLGGGAGPGVEAMLSSLGCSAIQALDPGDIAPELEQGLDRTVPLDRAVGIGLRSSRIVTVPAQDRRCGEMLWAPPCDGSWMLCA